MGLLNDVKQEAKAEEKVAATKTTDKAEKKAKNKEKKQAKRNALTKILDYCREHNILAEEVALLTPSREGFFGGADGLFEKLFPNAKVGDKVTAFEMFERTDKNIKQMVKKCAEWEEKGRHHVKYDASTKTFSVVAL